MAFFSTGKLQTKVMLTVLTVMYTVNELGHFLLGTLTRKMAQSVQYGDKSCIAVINHMNFSLPESVGKFCLEFTSETSCNTARVLNDSEIQICEWNYNGRGNDYQILAGPSFMACLTTAGIIWSFAARKVNRVVLLGVASFGVSLALGATAFATQYWHLVVCRMGLAACAAACAPLATGLLSESFPSTSRALVLGIFNCGIFVGFGASFSIGTYVSDTTFFNESWRTSFFLTGLLAFLPAVGNVLAVRETRSNANNNQNACDVNSNFTSTVKSEQLNLCQLFMAPEMIILIFAACIRHSAGYTWGYNSFLFFQTYYPEVDVGMWLTTVSIIGGITGCVLGGIVCDIMVVRYGPPARPLFLAVSLFIATPLASTVLVFKPPLSLLGLFFTYLNSEAWFGAFYSALLESSHGNQNETVVAIVIFMINNVGGNIPIFVEHLARLTNYRVAILIQYPGALLASSVLFLLCWATMRRRIRSSEVIYSEKKALPAVISKQVLNTKFMQSEMVLSFPD